MKLLRKFMRGDGPVWVILISLFLIGLAAIIVTAFAIQGALIMFGWNNALVPLLGWQEISFKTAVAIGVLLSLLTGFITIRIKKS